MAYSWNPKATVLFEGMIVQGAQVLRPDYETVPVTEHYNFVVRLRPVAPDPPRRGPIAWLHPQIHTNSPLRPLLPLGLGQPIIFDQLYFWDISLIGNDRLGMSAGGPGACPVSPAIWLYPGVQRAVLTYWIAPK